VTALPLLDQKVVVIVGVGPALGSACARLCAEHGASVTVAARTPNVVEPLVKELEGQGCRALGRTADITNVEDCQALVKATLDAFGRIDGLVNVAYAGPDQRSFEECDEDLGNWRDGFEVNVFGTLQMTKAVLPAMRSQGGSIVMINTMSAELPSLGLGGYTGSKAALAAITRTLGLELGAYRIRVNGLHPAGILNDPAREHIQLLADRDNISYDDQYRRIVALYPLGYIPTSEDYAGTVVYMLSDLSRPLTGQAVHVNGGRWFH
jgi:NAD(P)-dependent dehydrogenase (short-subunit alcohol dehydrogenase family)